MVPTFRLLAKSEWIQAYPFNVNGTHSNVWDTVRRVPSIVRISHPLPVADFTSPLISPATRRTDAAAV
jgi:hypothetical protein